VVLLRRTEDRDIHDCFRLLVDDLVDSRWTLAVAAVALLDAGSGPVSPFVLAKSVSD